MNTTRNIIFAFAGGVAIGGLAVYGYLKKTGKLIGKTLEIEDGAQNSEKSIKPKGDEPSFIPPKVLDTHKVRYDGIITKPELEDISKKYQQTEFDKDMAEREYPEEEEDEETALQNEIGEALMDHPNEFGEYETDGFGFVLSELNSKRKDNILYLVHVEHAGEVYPLEDLVYYAGDDVLCDVMDVPIDDVDRLVGDALQYFGQDGDGACGEGPDKLYVRNCSIGFEYEITRKDEYFGAHLYGASDEEVKEAVRSGRNKKGRSRTHLEED